MGAKEGVQRGGPVAPGGFRSPVWEARAKEERRGLGVDEETPTRVSDDSAHVAQLQAPRER